MNFIDNILTNNKLTTKELKEKADYIRKDLIENAIKNGAGHIAPSLSCVDILVVLYYEILNIQSLSNWNERDRFILSKGHGCYGLYSILADIGLIPKEEWINFYNGSCLTGCVERHEEFGLEASCGSLGHGLPIAVGMAFGAKLQSKKFRIYCMVGDGEMQEGTNWEAIQFAVKHKLSNLTVIIDNNALQAMDFTENIMGFKDADKNFLKKMTAFGLEAQICDGHDIESLISVLKNWVKNQENTAPQVLIANTVKGYGLLCMENIPKFHFRMPTPEELKMGNRYE